MHFQHHISASAPSRAVICAITIALGGLVGGFVPLLPYFFASHVSEGLIWSVSVTMVALFLFGYVNKHEPHRGMAWVGAHAE